MPRRRKREFQLISDQPLLEGKPAEWDGLGFRDYAKALSNAAWATPGPFTFGIFGEWGVGKTSLMRLIEDSLKTQHEQKVLTVWFNAWRYEQAEHPILPLAGTIIDELNSNKDFRGKLKDEGRDLVVALRSMAYGFSGRARLQVPGFADLQGSFSAKDAINRGESLSESIPTELFGDAFAKLRESYRLDDRKIVVFIDDLDRCFPDYALKLLESIKLVLAEPGFIFFLGVARTVIEGYLAKRYSEEFGVADFDGASYLDKLVQMPFHIPSHQPRMDLFCSDLLESFDNRERASLMKLLPAISAVCMHNPRLLIRFLNNLIVDRSIKSETAIEFFAVTRALQIRWPSFFDELLSDPALRRTILEQNSEADVLGTLSAHDTWNQITGFNGQQSLATLLCSTAGRDWLTNSDERNSAISFLETRNLEIERISFGNLEFDQATNKDFTGKTIKAENCKGVNLANAVFSGCTIVDCDFEGAILHKADFGSSKLIGVNLGDAKLTHTDFRNCELTNTRFDGADLTGALVESESWVEDQLMPCMEDFAENWRLISSKRGGARLVRQKTPQAQT